jgi:DNA-binding NtrC family response regulator
MPAERSPSVMVLSDVDIQNDVEHASRSAANVLITGSDASTRRAVAERIHQQSARGHLPLMIVSSAEHWDAVRRLPSGTIFFEDVCQLTARQQEELLQLLEQNGTPHATRWRIFAASQDRPYDKVTEGHFHIVLYYRLNVVHIAMP